MFSSVQSPTAEGWVDTGDDESVGCPIEDCDEEREPDLVANHLRRVHDGLFVRRVPKAGPVVVGSHDIVPVDGGVFYIPADGD